jgi:hypothetical protein
LLHNAKNCLFVWLRLLRTNVLPRLRNAEDYFQA